MLDELVMRLEDKENDIKLSICLQTTSWCFTGGREMPIGFGNENKNNEMKCEIYDSIM